MIQFHPEYLELSVPVATALLAFAGKDATRPHLGVGIDSGAVCATDGHTLLRFDADCAQRADGAPDLQGKVWARSYVEAQTKVARALKQPVRLEYARLDASAFPPVAQVIPEDGLEASRPIGFNPSYVAHLALVAKACACAGAMLVAARAELDPLKFRVAGPDLQATAVIMPMRI